MKKSIIKLAIAGIDHAEWYYNAHFANAEKAAELGVSMERYTAILAITSPRVHVSRNVKLTHQYLTTGSTQGMLPNTIKALQVYEETGHIRGKKVKAFYEAIMGNPDALVLDTWMAKAFHVEQSKLFNKDIYRRIASTVKRTANKLGLTIAETQAAIWAGTMREHNNNPRVI